MRLLMLLHLLMSFRWEHLSAGSRSLLLSVFLSDALRVAQQFSVVPPDDGAELFSEY